jgi:drug/metabolite transporter (DMT)-like permease
VTSPTDDRSPSHAKAAVRAALTGDALLLAVAVVAVSTSAPLIRRAEAPALAVAFWRNALAAAILVPVVVWRKRPEFRALGRNQRRRALVAGMLLAAHFATWVPSVALTTVTSSVALVATQPVWAAVLARRRGHQVPPGAWAGIAVALAGVLLLTGVDFGVSGRAALGDALALAGGMLAAAYVTVGAEVRQTMSTTLYTAIAYSVAAVLLLAVCLVGGEPLTGYGGGTWLCLLALTAGPQFLGHSLVNRVLRTTSATVVSVAILFEVPGAALLAWAAFGEAPPAGAYPAAALVAAGVLMVIRAARPRAAELAG